MRINIKFKIPFTKHITNGSRCRTDALTVSFSRTDVKNVPFLTRSQISHAAGSGMVVLAAVLVHISKVFCRCGRLPSMTLSNGNSTCCTASEVCSVSGRPESQYASHPSSSEKNRTVKRLVAEYCVCTFQLSFAFSRKNER